MPRFPRPAFCAALALLCAPAAHAQQPDSPFPQSKNPTMMLAVDATQAPRKLLHAHLSIPVKAGAQTLVFPEWIPGEHGPTGPIVNLSGLHFTAAGQNIVWRRDLLDMYAFHVQVPRGVTIIDVSLDLLLTSDTSGFSSSGLETPNLVNINWNQLLVYPKGLTADGVNVRASLRLPPGWQLGTALPVDKTSADTTYFAPAPLVTLIDSPVLAGRYFQRVPLGPAGQTPTHEIDMVSDSPEALAMPPATKTAYDNLVAEAGALFGARHYRDYHFLYTLSDHVASFGLEHHESSDDRLGERALVDDDLRKAGADLLPHEFVHSWNGKYRRPADLSTPDYQKPMQTDLLWVYEGQTQFWGKVLSARCGLWTAADFRDDLAELAANLDNRPGRNWRPLQDTADDAQILYNAPNQWGAARRGTDFYDEGVLVWLETDTLLRQNTSGKKSMDDFCKLFHGGASGPPRLVTYTFDDVVKTLSTLAPSYNWRAFLTERLTKVGGGAPLSGITNSGWKLVYTDTPSDYQKSVESAGKFASFRDSLGITVSDGDEAGRIGDIIPGLPAAVAGMGPGMKVLAVNGRRYTAQGLKDAVKAAASGTAPIELMAENGDFFHTFTLDYHGGLRYPHLVRDGSKPDTLTALIASHAAAPVR